MGYTKFLWGADTPLTPDQLNHTEGQYAAWLIDFQAHGHDSTYYTKPGSDQTFWNPTNAGHGSGCHADTLDGKHGAELIGGGVPPGLVVGWYGSAANIPPGWVATNGSSGSPNTINHFIMGSGGSGYEAPGATGGNDTATASGTINIMDTTLTADNIRHQHTFWDVRPYYPTAICDVYGSYQWVSTHVLSGLQLTGNAGSSTPAAHNHNGGGAPNTSTLMHGIAYDNRPPYMGIHFIMKS